MKKNGHLVNTDFPVGRDFHHCDKLTFCPSGLKFHSILNAVTAL